MKKLLLAEEYFQLIRLGKQQKILSFFVKNHRFYFKKAISNIGKKFPKRNGWNKFKL